MRKANVFFMTVAGLFLIVASLMKAHQVMTEPVVSEGFWESWLFFVIQIPLEFALGVWLVSGLFRKAGWLVGLVTFGFFIGVTAHKMMLDAESCGCFGRVHVKPWITLSFIDIPLFLSFLVFRPKGGTFFPPPWPSTKHFWGVACPSAVFIAVLVPTVVFNQPSREGVIEMIEPPVIVRQVAAPVEVFVEPGVELDVVSEQRSDQESQAAVEVVEADGEVVAVGETLVEKRDLAAVVDEKVVEPNAIENESGQREAANEVVDAEENLLAGYAKWDKLDNIDIGDQLRSGRAVVMLFSSDCSTCHDAMPRYDEMGFEMFVEETPITLAFVEVPPYGGDEEEPVAAVDSPCLVGKLDESRKWYVTTPFVVAMQDGVPLKSWEGWAPDYDEIKAAYQSVFEN